MTSTANSKNGCTIKVAWCMAMAVAMSAVAIVLSVLGMTTPSALIPLLSLGLFCLAIIALQA